MTIVPLPPGYERVEVLADASSDFTIEANPASPRRANLVFFGPDDRKVYAIEIALYVTYNNVQDLAMTMFRPDGAATGYVIDAPGAPGDNDLGSGTSEGQLLHLALDGNGFMVDGADPWAGVIAKPDMFDWHSFFNPANDRVGMGGPSASWQLRLEDFSGGTGGTVHYARMTFVVKTPDGTLGVSNNGWDFGTMYLQRAGSSLTTTDPTPKLIPPGKSIYSALHVSDGIGVGFFPGQLLTQTPIDAAYNFNEHVYSTVSPFGRYTPTLRDARALLDGGGDVTGTATVKAALFDGDDGHLVARSDAVTINAGDPVDWVHFTFSSGFGHSLDLAAASARARHDGGANDWGLYWLAIEVSGDPIVRCYTYPVPANMVANGVPSSGPGSTPHFAVTGGRGTLGDVDAFLGGVVWKALPRIIRSSPVAVGEYLGIITDKIPLGAVGGAPDTEWSFGIIAQTVATTVGAHADPINEVEFHVRWYDNTNTLIHTDTLTDGAATGFDSFPVSMVQEGLAIPATAWTVAIEARWVNAGVDTWTTGAVGDTAEFRVWNFMATPGGNLRSMPYAEWIRRFDRFNVLPLNFRTNSIVYPATTYGIDMAQGPYEAVADDDPLGVGDTTQGGSIPAFMVTTASVFPEPPSLYVGAQTPLAEKPLAYITGEDDFSSAVPPPPEPGPPTSPLPTLCVVGTGLGQTIPDDDPSSPVFVDFDFTGIKGTITDISVSLYVTHTSTPDLSVVLFAPGEDTTPGGLVNIAGVSLDLLDGQGGVDWGTGTGPDEAVHITQHALTQMPYDGAFAPFAGDGFLPTGDGSDPSPIDFSTFFGKPADGVWRLRLQDFAAADVGVVQWAKMCVTVTGGETPWVPPKEEDMYYGRLPFHEAQRIFTTTGPEPGAIVANCGWYHTRYDPEWGSFGIVRSDGPLADLVGERVLVTYSSPQTSETRTVVVYVHDEGDMLEDISISRRAFLALSSLAAGQIDVFCQAMSEDRS